MLRQPFLLSEIDEPAWRFFHILERKAEGAVMHGHQPVSAKMLESFYRLIRSHMDAAKGSGMVRANR